MFFSKTRISIFQGLNLKKKPTLIQPSFTLLFFISDCIIKTGKGINRLQAFYIGIFIHIHLEPV